ncbi:mesothelin [Erinaceus europaeus]|uniref:Mesothelin n=1 Tax=Erinaceus europaeus TaxID=9365 RepID=A0ABM3VWH0_ERIEU|nr:mesothelin [Erinaceus europaeus]
MQTMALQLAQFPLGCGRIPALSSLLILFLNLGWVLSTTVHFRDTRLAQPTRVPSRVHQDREEGCPPGHQPNKVDENLLFYEEWELKVCVDAALLEEEMDLVNKVPFTQQQLHIFKDKLDQQYPQGYPESLVSTLKYFFLLMEPEDIHKWNITSLETVESLLEVAKGRQMSAQVDALVDRFIVGQGQLDRDIVAKLETLGVLRPAHLCFLSPDVLASINHTLLWKVEPQDLTACEPLQIEVLYQQAHQAFVNLSKLEYFSRILPFLGGAPMEGLQLLIEQKIHVDMPTFKKLQREVVLSLTVPEVEMLLGPHVEQLLAEQHHSPVREWVARQRQSDLDRLGLGLQGGIPNGYLVLNHKFREALSRGPQLQGPGPALGAIPLLLLAAHLS